MRSKTIEFTSHSMDGAVHSTIGRDTIRVIYSRLAGVRVVVIRCSHRVNAIKWTRPVISQNRQDHRTMQVVRMLCCPSHQWPCTFITVARVDRGWTARSYRPWWRHQRCLHWPSCACRKFWPLAVTHRRYHRFCSGLMANLISLRRPGRISQWVIYYFKTQYPKNVILF